MRLSAIYEALGEDIRYEIIDIDALLSWVRRYPTCFGVVGVDDQVWISHHYDNPDEHAYDGPHEALMAAADLPVGMEGARFLAQDGTVSVGPMGGAESAYAVLAVLDKVYKAKRFPVYWDAMGMGGMANSREEVLEAAKRIRQALARPSTRD